MPFGVCLYWERKGVPAGVVYKRLMFRVVFGLGEVIDVWVGACYYHILIIAM